MIKDLLAKDLVLFSETQPENWEDAIKISCQKLLEHDYINQTYVDEIISSVKEFGPYIVIIPEVAMPHANAKSSGVLGTAISMTKFPEDVIFYDEENKEEKPARLFFTLAAKNSEEHLSNITQLMELLSDDEVLEKLKNIKTIEELQTL